MILEKTGYTYQDLTIVPAITSEVESRSKVNPFIGKTRLPIFTAPMSCVVNEKNYKEFETNHIIPIIPRSVDYSVRRQLLYKTIVAFSLSEFEQLFLHELDDYEYNYFVCIDIANGHMTKLHNVISKAKELFKHLKIITGNIANPYTLPYLECAGVDYIRVGIGSGNCCITSSNTGIHYPMASLIANCREVKEALELNIKIIADGGIKNYSDVIKALALGADFVMIGSLLASCYESAAEGGWENSIKDLSEKDKRTHLKTYHHTKPIYGMASKKGQCDLNLNSHTAEGIAKEIPCKQTLSQWSENMIDYIKSAMSYCGSVNLSEFIGNQVLIPVSYGTQMTVNK